MTLLQCSEDALCPVCVHIYVTNIEKKLAGVYMRICVERWGKGGASCLKNLPPNQLP